MPGFLDMIHKLAMDLSTNEKRRVKQFFTLPRKDSEILEFYKVLGMPNPKNVPWTNEQKFYKVKSPTSQKQL